MMGKETGNDVVQDPIILSKKRKMISAMTTLTLDEMENHEDMMMTALTLGSPTSRAPRRSVVARLSVDPQPDQMAKQLPAPAISTTHHEYFRPQIVPLNRQFAVSPTNNQFLFSLSLPPPPPPPSSLVFNDVRDQLVPRRARARVAAVAPASHHRQPRGRRNSAQQLKPDKPKTVPKLYPWSTTLRAKVESMDRLLSQQIVEITGLVQCKRCEQQYEMGFDLKAEFKKLWIFISQNKSAMNDRAPPCWANPVLPACRLCKQENSAKPVIADKKKAINWLFLLLGQLLGCCTLEQLKYFCKHTTNHRTGAKDRVLYLSYLGLCFQLDPEGPFLPLCRYY